MENMGEEWVVADYCRRLIQMSSSHDAASAFVSTDYAIDFIHAFYFPAIRHFMPRRHVYALHAAFATIRHCRYFFTLD